MSISSSALSSTGNIVEIGSLTKFYILQPAFHLKDFKPALNVLEVYCLLYFHPPYFT